MFELALISAELPVQGEAEIFNYALASGVKHLHLRRPAWESEEFEALLREVEPAHHACIRIHNHFELKRKYPDIKLHFPHRIWAALASSSSPENRSLLELASDSLASLAIHSSSDLEIAKRFEPDYFLISPVFKSISKKHAAQPLEREQLEALLLSSNEKLFALGGISPKLIALCHRLGFSGAAVLGYVWNSSEPLFALNEILAAWKTLAPTV